MKVLVTGGAGFIGSNLVKALLDNEQIHLVRVMDNLSNGSLSNIEPFLNNSKFEFVQADIRSYDECLSCMKDIDIVSHQAALGSVPRSIRNPRESTEVNILGTVNILQSCVEMKVKRVILAFSSSTYGDSLLLPKRENIIGKPLSPYAVTKSAIEDYCRVFGDIYGLNWIGFRYFNVFGPNQSALNPYAAVIPLMAKAFLTDEKFVINGDGLTSRDFTYVDNIVDLNLRAIFTGNKLALNNIYNAACSRQTNLIEIIQELKRISGKDIRIEYGPERDGDVKHSLADISKAKELLGYEVLVDLPKGLEKAYKWYAKDLI